MKSLLFAMAVLALSHSAALAQEKVYTFFPDPAILHGKLVRLQERTPSGHTVMVLAIQLDQAVTVKPSPNARDQDIDTGTYPHVKVIQVFFPGVLGDKNARAMLRHRLTLNGTLSERLTPGQFTDVTIDVKSSSAP